MIEKKKLILFPAFIICLIVTLFFIFLSNFNIDVNLNIKDTLPNGDGKKATVILLGGQSNASGCSYDEYLQQNVTEEKYKEYEQGYNNIYINYVSDNRTSCEFVKCSVRMGAMENTFGPELGLAEKLNELYPDHTFFIIKCAWSGTNLFDQWLSPSSSGNTGVLYESFVKFVDNNIKYLVSKNYDIKIEAMCWMQGESDSFSIEHATKYELHLNNFIQDIRSKFKNYASNDGIAFIDAYIADNPMYWVYCDLVNASKKSVASVSSINVVIDTNAIGLTCLNEPKDNPDKAHYDAMSEIKLGHAFGDEISKFID